MKNDNEKKYFSESSLLIEKMEKGTPLKKEIPLDNYSESNGLTKKVTEGTPLQSIIQEEDKNYSESAKFLNDLHKEKEVQDTKDYSDSADFIYGLMAEKHTAGLSKDQDTLPEHREKSQGTVLLNRKNSVSDKQYSDSSKFIDKAKREDSDLFDETGTLPLPSQEERDAIIRERDLKRKALLGKEASTAQSFREKQPERPLISDTRGLTLVIKSEGQSTKTKQRISTVNHIFSLILSYLFLLVVALLFIFPFYWMIITSFKSGDEIRGYLPGLEQLRHLEPEIRLRHLCHQHVNCRSLLHDRYSLHLYLRRFRLCKTSVQRKEPHLRLTSLHHDDSWRDDGRHKLCHCFELRMDKRHENWRLYRHDCPLHGLCLLHLFVETELHADSKRALPRCESRWKERLAVFVESHGPACDALTCHHLHPQAHGILELLHLAELSRRWPR